MVKFFVVSDIHGFYDEFISALEKAQYDNTNPNHYLVVCGDVFDRGKQPNEILRYLNLNPRTILIRGNHEDLFDDMCLRGYAMMHDRSNGTYDTACILGKHKGLSSPDEIFDRAYKCTRGLFDKMVNYFETEHYVFVHGDVTREPCSYIYPPNWRKAKKSLWEDARWSSPLKYKRDWLEHRAEGVDGKTLVVGHWHCSKGHHLIDGTPEFGKGANFDIFHYKNLIAIDACTAYSGKVNVLVIEDEFLKNT